MNMRALYVVPSWFTLHYHLRGHLSFMRSRGIEVAAAGNADPRAAAAAKREGVRYSTVDLDTAAISPLKDLKALLRIAQLADVHDCDVIYSCTKKGALISGLAGRLTGVPCVVYHVRGVRGLGEENVHPLKKLIFGFIERLACALTHRVVFISRSNMELYVGMKICPAGKAVLFGGGSSNGVDTERFRRTADNDAKSSELRKQHGIPEDAFVVGFVGRPVLEKGIMEMQEAWTAVRARHHNAHLMIVSPPETDCPQAIDALSSDDRVHFTGFMEEPVTAYAAMDCLLAPSHEIEGFGNVATEAGSMELPVVATRVTGLMDAVSDGETGLLVRPGDTRALAEALDRLITDSELARRLGENGRRRCISHFRQEIIWNGFADLYESLAGPDGSKEKQRGGEVADRRNRYA